MNVLTSYRMSLNFGVFDYVLLLFYFLLYIIAELRPVIWFHLHDGKKIDKPLIIGSSSLKERKKTVDDVPGPKPRIPILGTRWIFSSLFGQYKLNKIHEAYTDMFNTHGPIIREEALWNFPVISLIAKEDIEKVYRFASKYPVRPPTEITMHYRQSRPDRFTNTGIVNEQGETWGRMREILTPELRSTESMRRFAPELSQIAEDFTKLIRNSRNQDGEIVRFEELAQRVGLESTSALVLGRRMGFLEEDSDDRHCTELAAAVSGHFIATRDSYYGLPFWKLFPNHPVYSKYVKSEEKIYDIVSKYVEQALGGDGELYEDDAIQSLFISVIQAHGLDIRDKKAAMVDFIAAGIFTLGNTLIFVLYLIAKHPEVQQRLYEELIELAPDDCPVTADRIRCSKYLKACVTEAFRVLPTAPSIARVLESPMELSGYDCPAGTVVLCHSWLASLKEENFTDAKKFIPERWLPENKNTMKSSPFILAPFGVGKRSCPGKRFSEQELHLVVAKMVKEFEIGFEGELNIQFEFLMVPGRPVNFTFRDRV